MMWKKIVLAMLTVGCSLIAIASMYAGFAVNHFLADQWYTFPTIAVCIIGVIVPAVVASYTAVMLSEE